MLFVNFICYIKHYAKTWPVFASNLANFIDSLSRTLFLLCVTASVSILACNILSQGIEFQELDANFTIDSVCMISC